MQSYLVCAGIIFNIILALNLIILTFGLEYLFASVSIDYPLFLGTHLVGRAENFSFPYPSVIIYPFRRFWVALREARTQFGDFAGRLFSAAFSLRDNRSDLLHSAPVSLGLAFSPYVPTCYILGPV